MSAVLKLETPPVFQVRESYWDPNYAIQLGTKADSSFQVTEGRE